MSIAASSVECDDLRLSYSGVMSQIDIVPDGRMALNSNQSGSPILTGQAKSSASTAGMVGSMPSLSQDSRMAGMASAGPSDPVSVQESSCRRLSPLLQA